MKKQWLIALALMPMASFASDSPKPGQHFIENWDLNADGEITLEELKEKRGNVFYTFDSDDDGNLTAEEYAYFDEARKNDRENNADEGHKGEGAMNTVQAGMTMDFNDIDGNGLVSSEEFISQTAEWLAIIDRNGDGVITFADFGKQS